MLDHRTVQVHLADLQDGIIDLSATNSPADIRRSAGVLLEVARLLEIPVTASAAPRPGGPGFVEDLPASVRSGPSAWDHAPTRDTIEAAGRKTLVLCGVTSEIVVLHTALDALAAGYAVQVLVDACGGMSPRTEAAALRQIEVAGGRVSSVASLVGDLVRDFTTPTGSVSIAALHKLL